ncbi:MAG: c-type cytochrome [Pirellulaceae bacterium]|nr:c-type cytochrome [Pirellulaceae bacterium]MDP6554070.1 c-type cytochrome [Pirellulaceae bacterium]
MNWNHAKRPTGIVAGVLIVIGMAMPSIAAETFRQSPTVAPSRLRDAPEDEPAPSPKLSAAKELLKHGPKPTWIWGPNHNRDYAMRKRFDGGATTAWLQATCDNSMRLLINGHQVAQSDSWENPVRVEVSKHLREGTNEIVASVGNAGSVAGFAFKLALSNGEEVRYVISDESWESVEKLGPWVPVRTMGKMGIGPWKDVFSKPAGLAEPDRGIFHLLPGFQVELLYTVPKNQQGSWVSIAFDDRGRLIASDQGGHGLYRITPPSIDGKGETKVERLSAKITSAQGLLYAFDSLYVSVNGGPGSGLYRLRDTSGDDQFDEVLKLKALAGGGEHGPHALRLSPDGKSIYLIAGNHTNPPAEFSASRLPSNWSEDHLLPRQWDARGHARGKLAPGGWIAKTDPDGKSWEMFSTGYRNPYDMDFNADGDLFAYDADMEWDMGMPWYRPTRVVHATSGSEFGWRSGTGKWPTYYVDSLPQLVNVGPGSPVGAAFGYGTLFPEKYQHAFYICDWTFGTMYAVHSQASGAGYTATKEEFISRTPLPLTDVAVGPDGAMYFTTGGRGAQSELYRVTYRGKASTKAIDAHDTEFAALRALRKEIETYHTTAKDPQSAVAFLWPHLGHHDRHIRYAARVAIEHQPVEAWSKKAVNSSDPVGTIQAVVALARQGDPTLQPKVLAALDRIDIANLSESQQLDLLRAWSLVFIRMSKPGQQTATRLVKKLDGLFPAESDRLNRELCAMLVYLNSPTVVTKTLELLGKETTQETLATDALLARNRGYGGTIAQMLANQPDLQKLHYAFTLRNVRYGWTFEQRRQYLVWLAEARDRSGGASYQGFIDNMRKDALENASEAERKLLASEIMITPVNTAELPKATGPGRAWTLADLVGASQQGLKARDFENGRKMFAAARCIVCHRFEGRGGATGPDLTNVAGRFTPGDLSESIVNPSKVVSDQYRASVVVTTSGKVYTGRLSGDQEDKLTILIDPEDASKVVTFQKSEVESVKPSAVSLMPDDLLKELNRDEVLDLFAYMLSRGNPNDALFAERQ